MTTTQAKTTTAVTATKKSSGNKKLAGKEHSISSAMESLTRKKVFFSERRGVTMISLERAEPLGNKSWGKLDFLVKKCGMNIDMITKHDYDKQFLN